MIDALPSVTMVLPGGGERVVANMVGRNVAPQRDVRKSRGALLRNDRSAVHIKPRANLVPASAWICVEVEPVAFGKP